MGESVTKMILPTYVDSRDALATWSNEGRGGQMFWFVTAVVVLMLALIDLTTNLHVLVTRRLRRKLERRQDPSLSQEIAERARAREMAAEIPDGDPETLLRALVAVRTDAAA
jgi:hypothetical protein